METQGILKVVYDTQNVSDKFKKREFVITTEGNTPYPQHVPFQLVQDKCELLNNYNPGDEVKVQFNVRGRLWSGPQGDKYFVSLDVWRIELISSGSTTNNEGHDAQSTFVKDTNDNDQLPF